MKGGREEERVEGKERERERYLNTEKLPLITAE